MGMGGAIITASSNGSKRETMERKDDWMKGLEKDSTLSELIDYSAANLIYNTMYLYVTY